MGRSLIRCKDKRRFGFESTSVELSLERKLIFFVGDEEVMNHLSKNGTVMVPSP